MAVFYEDAAHFTSAVMAGLGPAIHVLAVPGAVPKAWVPGPSPGMTMLF